MFCNIYCLKYRPLTIKIEPHRDRKVPNIWVLAPSIKIKFLCRILKYPKTNRQIKNMARAELICIFLNFIFFLNIVGPKDILKIVPGNEPMAKTYKINTCRSFHLLNK